MKNNLTLEDRVKRRNIQNIILKVIATSGMIGVTLVAPGALGAMNKMGLLSHGRQKESIYRSRKRLIKKGFIEFYEGKLKITDKGKAHLVREDMYTATRNNKRRWDGKWRVLIFDIPEKKRFVRNQIRRALLTFT